MNAETDSIRARLKKYIIILVFWISASVQGVFKPLSESVLLDFTNYESTWDLCNRKYQSYST